MKSRITVFLQLLALYFALLPLVSNAAVERERIALVIGNSSYQKQALKNPKNDATDIAAVLRNLGFQVTLKLDLNKIEMRQAVRSFGRKLSPDSIGFIYYSGHGVQYDGKNYLIPIGGMSQIQEAWELPDLALSIRYFTETFKHAGNNKNILILDACRDDPFSFTRNITRGLKVSQEGRGMIIAYAAMEGQAALDGKDRNSPYAAHLIKWLSKNLPIEFILKRVGGAVAAETKGKQTPTYTSMIYQDLYLSSDLKQKTLSEEMIVVPPPAPEIITGIENRQKLTIEEKIKRVIPKKQHLPNMERDRYGIYADVEIETWEKPVIQRFRWIEPGTFMMGSLEIEGEIYQDEVRHQVTLTEGYWIADTETTQELWEAVMRKNLSEFKGKELPVETVSWSDVQRFLRKINRINENKFSVKLPTEAQWEYAARAGTTTPFSFGKNITTEQVNFNGNYPYNNGKKGKYRQATVKVKSLPSNQWGLYEMHGNVWEWVADQWQEKLPMKPVKNPLVITNHDGDPRVLRGGSWSHRGRNVRAAYRHPGSMPYRGDNIGFRICLEPTFTIEKYSAQVTQKALPMK